MARIKDLKRMCKNMKCKDCPLSDGDVSGCLIMQMPAFYPNNVDEIVDKWVETHPVKTYAMDFFEKFPNAPKDSNGAPIACWKHIYGDGNDCGPGSCIECWKREMKEE